MFTEHANTRGAAEWTGGACPRDNRAQIHQAGIRKKRGETIPEELIISSDSHVFEPPDLWTTRIEKRFLDRAPRMERVGDVDHLIVEGNQSIAGIGLISNAGSRFEAPETLSDHGRFEDVRKGGYDPEEHIRDMAIDGVSGEVLYPSQGLFYFTIEDSELMSAIFRTYNEWLAEFCSTDRNRLNGIAMINLDDVDEGIRELERAAKMGLVGAMISEYPTEEFRYDNPRYERFWAVAEALEMPLSLHTATMRERNNLAVGVREASGRSNDVFWPSTSMCDMIFSGVFERYPKLTIAVVEFELAWAAHVIRKMDYTYRERHEEATHRFKDGKVPSDFFHDNVYLSFQEDAVGIMLRHVIGVESLMWGSDYPHAESTFPRSREIIDEILEGVSPEDRSKIIGGNVARLYNLDVSQLVPSSA